MSLTTTTPKRRIGYARVSTEAQDLTRQQKALNRAGCDPVFADKASGKSMVGRPALAKAIAELDEGDELVIAEWDRATRSMWDGLQIIKAVIDAKASIQILDRSYIDLTTPMGRGFMAMLSALAEDERLRIIKRTHEGRQLARGKGVKWAGSQSSRCINRKKHGGGLPKAKRRASLPKATASAGARFRGFK